MTKSKWGQQGGAAAAIQGQQLQGTKEKSWSTSKDDQYQVSPGIDTVTTNKKGFHQDDEKMMRTARAYSAMNQSVNSLLGGLLGREGKFVHDASGDMLAKRQAIVDKYNEQISTDAIAGYSSPTTFSYSKGEREQEADANSWTKQPDEAPTQTAKYSKFGDANDEAKYLDNLSKKVGVNMPDKGFNVQNYGDAQVVQTIGFTEGPNGEMVAKPGYSTIRPVQYIIHSPSRAKDYIKMLMSRMSKDKMSKEEYEDGQNTINTLNQELSQYK